MSRARVKVFLEQVTVSAANFLVTIILSRKLGVEEFGVYAVGFSIYVIVQGFQRAFVCIPFAVLFSSEESSAHSLDLWKKLNSQLVGVVVFVSILCLVLCWLAGLGVFFIAAILISVVLYFGMAGYEFYRRVLIQQGKVDALLPAAFFYALAANLLVFAVLEYAKYALLAGVLVASSALIASLYARNQAGLGRRLIVDAREYRDFRSTVLKYGRWGGASHIVFTAYNGLVPIVVGFSAGAVASAYFNASRNLLQPIQTLINAVDSVDKPRAARAFREKGLEGLVSSIRSTLYVLIGVGGTYLLLVSCLSSWVVKFVYGPEYEMAASYVVYWVGVFALMILVQPIESVQYVLKSTFRLFLGRCAAGAAGVAALFLLVPVYGVAGGLLALIVGWGVALVASVLLLLMSFREKG